MTTKRLAHTDETRRAIIETILYNLLEGYITRGKMPTIVEALRGVQPNGDDLPSATYYLWMKEPWAKELEESFYKRLAEMRVRQAQKRYDEALGRLWEIATNDGGGHKDHDVLSAIKLAADLFPGLKAHEEGGGESHGVGKLMQQFIGISIKVQDRTANVKKDVEEEEILLEAGENDLEVPYKGLLPPPEPEDQEDELLSNESC